MSEFVGDLVRVGRTRNLGGIVELWPLAVIAAGLLASVAWTAALAYGAYLLASWAFA